ncbi:vWA domain-containing protein [Corynebacterium sp. 335C]
MAPDLARSFAAQSMTAGSSGWLSDRFREGRGHADALINYESVLLSDPGLGLEVLVPADGVVTADYPLSPLASASPEDRGGRVDELTRWLLDEPQQWTIAETTQRRTSAGGGDAGRIEFEMPFPARQEVASLLLGRYSDEFRPAPRSVYALDTSGSMEGEGIESLQTALLRIINSGEGLGLPRLAERAKTTFLTFGGGVGEPVTVELDPGDSERRRELSRMVTGMAVGGNTALFPALAEAYRILEREDLGNRIPSIVLMATARTRCGSARTSSAPSTRACRRT